MADFAIYCFLLSMTDLSTRCLESYLTDYPWFLCLQSFVWHSTTLCTLFQIFTLNYFICYKLFEIPCLFNQCRVTVLTARPLIGLILQRFNAAFTFSIKFEAVCAETSSNLGIVRLFLEIRDLLTINPWFVTDGWWATA